MVHHFGEDSTTVVPTATGFRVIFRNKITGGEIIMDVPESGVLEDATRKVSRGQVEAVARNVAHILRSGLA